MQRILFNIGELAERSGISRDTLRYYERIGLLAPSGRSGGGYRQYEQSALERLSFIHRAQFLGLSLAEVREIIRVADDGSAPCEHVEATLERHLQELDARIAELRLLKRNIGDLLAHASNARTRKACVCGIIESADPSRSKPVGLTRARRSGAAREHTSR